MKTIPYSLLATLALVLACGEKNAARAQDSGAPTPSPPARPYVAPLHGDFTMLERITYNPKPASSAAPADSAEAPPAGSLLQEVQAVETGIIRKDKKILVDGTSTEIWRSGALRFLLDSKAPEGVIVASHQMSYYDDPPDFKEVEWVGPKSYQGVQTLGDTSCYFYLLGDQKAWIDLKTRWPLQFESPTMRITYTYGTPGTPLQLPPLCAKKFEQMRRAWAGLPPN